ncbi:hypothetical protein GPALN_010351 [Globodera pallida]|nr:hypothetical protein GPALN_010351 [Globodera pallida]
MQQLIKTNVKKISFTLRYKSCTPCICAASRPSGPLGCDVTQCDACLQPHAIRLQLARPWGIRELSSGNIGMENKKSVKQFSPTLLM